MTQHQRALGLVGHHARQVARILVRGPQIDHRPTRSQHRSGGVKAQQAADQRLGLRQVRRDVRRAQRDVVGRMKRAHTLPLKPRHIGEVGQRLRGTEAGDELGKRFAVDAEQLRARWGLRHMHARHGVEEIGANQFAHDRVGVSQRADE